MRSTTNSWLFPPNTREVQFDEKWSFVGKKEKHCDPADPGDAKQGDNWNKERTGGRPKAPYYEPSPELRYATVHKTRAKERVVKIDFRIVFGSGGGRDGDAEVVEGEQ